MNAKRNVATRGDNQTHKYHDPIQFMNEQSQCDINIHLNNRLNALEDASKLYSGDLSSIKKDNATLKNTIKAQCSQIGSLKGT